MTALRLLATRNQLPLTHAHGKAPSASPVDCLDRSGSARLRQVACRMGGPQGFTPPRSIARVQASAAVEPVDVPSIASVSWEEFKANSDCYVGRKPVIIHGADHDGTNFEKLQRLLSPQALIASDVVHTPIKAFGNRDDEGKRILGANTTLAETFDKQHRGAVDGQGYFALFLNETHFPIYFDDYLPAGWQAWKDYLGDSLDPWPDGLLNPYVGSLFFLSIGQENGAQLHHHDHNFNLQVCGTKRWRLLSPEDSAFYTDPATQQPLNEETVFKPEFHQLLNQRVWDHAALAHGPQPLEFDLSPGFTLYIPTGWDHATWNLSNYNVSCVRGAAVDLGTRHEPTPGERA